jgi:hypothetical protein
MLRTRSGSVDRLSLDNRRRPSGLGAAATPSIPRPVDGDDAATLAPVALSTRVVERVLVPLPVLR